MNGSLYVRGIGFAAPGIGSAPALFDHFDGLPLEAPADWTAAPDCLPRRQLLRLSESTRIAIMAAEQIGPSLPTDGAWVFASSTAEGWILNEILASLCRSEVMIQPLRFQNAVHNAAQGQWSIVAGVTGPATSVAAYDHSAGAGLLKALMQAAQEETPVGLVVFDAPLPPPLHEKRPFAMPMAAALALTPLATAGSRCRLNLSITRGEPLSDPAGTGAAEALVASGNPVRFMLPLLERIHRADPRPVVLGLPGGAALKVSVGEADRAE